MLNDVRTLIGKLFRHRIGPRRASPAAPNFDEDELFGHLNEPLGAAQAWRAGQRDAAWEALITHFRKRLRPVGLITADRIPDLLADAQRRYPAWRGRLLAKVRDERHQGLAVYDRSTAPLSAAFDWNVAAGGPIEDRLYGVRPHRLGFLPRWALACHYDGALVAALEAVLAGWMTAARVRGGDPAFRSSHVVVYHYVALLLAWPFLAAIEETTGGSELAALRRRVLLILYEDSRFLRAVAGSGAANNHLLAERFADWLTAALLPEFDHSLGRATAEAAWLDELERQVYEDGGSFEQSLHYQEHGCEMAAAYLLVCRHNGWQVPARALIRIERMLDYQLTLAGPALIPLAVGNSTEDPLLPLGIGEGWQSGALREIQRACFDKAAPPAPAEDPTLETAFWLLQGQLADSASATDPPAADGFRSFPDGGFCVFEEAASASRLILRLGPAPRVSAIGGHSHCDLLSFSMSAGTQALLAQPGTYSYRFKPHPALPHRPNLRAHFASAGSRSGFFFEGLEPYGPLQGDFRDWSLPCQVEPRQAWAAAAGLSWAEGRVVGKGDYVGHSRGVIHVWGSYWLVYDRLPARQEGASAFIGWQFAPGVVCQLKEGGALEAHGTASGARLVLLTAGVGAGELASGSYAPLRGWVSPSYGRLEPAANVRFAVPPEAQIAASLLAVAPAVGLGLDLAFTQGEALGLRVTGSGEETQILLNGAAEPGELNWGDFRFQGRLLYLRRQRDGRLRVRALGLRSLVAAELGLELKADVPADFELLLDDGRLSWPRGPCAELEVMSHGATSPSP